MVGGLDWEPYLDGEPSPSEDAIAQLSRSAPGPLPAEYLRDLHDHPGEVPVPGRVTVGRGSAVIGPLLLAESSERRRSYRIDRAVAAVAEWSHGAEQARGLWPFANDTAGGLFCFDFRQDIHEAVGPPVVFIDLAGADFEKGEFEEGEVLPVAASYHDLLASLHDR